MEHARIHRMFSTLFFTVVIFLPCLCAARKSTQADIDDIAANLKIGVEVSANHFINGTYTIAFKLSNIGRKPILNTDDWQIIFSLHDGDLFTRPEFTVQNFTVKPYSKNFYMMTRSAKSPFSGIGPGRMFKITTQAKGLSVFLSDMQPRYIIRANELTPKNIRSTSDDNLSFVKLVESKDKTNPTVATLTAIERTIQMPDTNDMNRIAETIIIPRPVRVQVTPDEPIDLANSTKIYIIYHGEISQAFKTFFESKFREIPGLRGEILVEVPQVADGDRIYTRLISDPSKSSSYYKITITKGRPSQGTNSMATNEIVLEATTEKGLHYAAESFRGIHGRYSEFPPHVTMEDEPRYDSRSVSLDLSKNFFPKTTILKFIELMSMYKLNKLILNLGDDFGWRLQYPASMAFDELTSVGAKRCANNPRCLPPYFGAGAEGTVASSGFLSQADFGEIIRAAKNLHVDVIPKINLLGGLFSAKKAAHYRYERMKSINKTEAERLHLFQGAPSMPAGTVLEKKVSAEGLLNHCNPQTRSFIEDVILGIVKAYNSNGVPLVGFHAGGDELTKFIANFESCKKQGLNAATLLKSVLSSLRQALPKSTALHVNEEAIVDPATGDCFEGKPGSPFKPENQIVHFHSTYVKDLDNLSAAQLAYLFGEVAEYPDPANASAIPDPMIPYNGPKAGLAPWLLPYKCANKGYKIILEPENFFALDQAYELDYNEPGNRDRSNFHIISLARLMVFEPENMYINLDITRGGQALLQYRLCKLYQCSPLTDAGKRNLLGIGATIDTRAMRSKEVLYYTILPRMLLFAEKAWTRGEHENVMKAEVPDTIVSPENVDHRTRTLLYAMQLFSNTLAYKELGRLENAGYGYRIPRLGASILLGLQFGQKPPYPLVVKSDVPTPAIEYKDLTVPNAAWLPLFSVDQLTGQSLGGFTFSFPESSQRILIRAKDPDSGRGGAPSLVEGKPEYYLPREISIDLREGTCLPIEQPWETDINTLTTKQWLKVISNIDNVLEDRRQFMVARERQLLGNLTEFNRANLQNYALPAVFEGIQRAMASGQDIDRLPAGNVMKLIHDKDREIFANRQTTVEARYQRWQQHYVDCKAGKAQVGTTNLSPSQPNAGPVPHTRPQAPAGQRIDASMRGPV